MGDEWDETPSTGGVSFYCLLINKTTCSGQVWGFVHSFYK